MLTFLKSQMPALQKLVYFSDKAAAQYKNCKNLKNLCLHQADCGIDAEWNFIATSHGKSPCDGIGGTIEARGKCKFAGNSAASDTNSTADVRLGK